MPVTCSTSKVRIVVGLLDRRGGDIGVERHQRRGGSRSSASASAIASAAGCISGQWNGADTGSRIARLAPFSLAMSSARSTAALWPEITTWLGSLSLATVQTSPCAASSATACAGVEIGAEQGRHRALADRHRRLHRLAAQLEQPRRRRQVERPGGAQAREYSPRLWPATKSALSARLMPPSCSARAASRSHWP